MSTERCTCDGRGLYAELTEAGVTHRTASRTHREGVRRFFLDRLAPIDQIALGDIWARQFNARAT